MENFIYNVANYNNTDIQNIEVMINLLSEYREEFVKYYQLNFIY